MSLTFADVLQAWSVVRRALPVTPLTHYPGLSEMCGCDVFVKHDNHLPTGAFKVRGGVNLLLGGNGTKPPGVVTATRGNHGQSLAWAAKQVGTRALIYVPHGNNPDKNRLMESLGAEVIVAGADFDEARQIAVSRAEKDRLRYVHVANTPELVAGVGTFAVEVLQELPGVEAIVVPVGSGSALAGTVLSVQALKPRVRVIGVQAVGACALANSLKSGVMETIAQASTFADGLATRCAFEVPFQILRGQIGDLVLVDEHEIADGVRLALSTTHNLPEGATGAAYAGLWKIREELKGQKVAVLHSGHNIEPAVLATLLRGETPAVC